MLVTETEPPDSEFDVVILDPEGLDAKRYGTGDHGSNFVITPGRLHRIPRGQALNSPATKMLRRSGREYGEQ